MRTRQTNPARRQPSIAPNAILQVTNPLNLPHAVKLRVFSSVIRILVVKPTTLLKPPAAPPMNAKIMVTSPLELQYAAK